MGKIRVKSFGDQEEEKKQERKIQVRKEAKDAKKTALDTPNEAEKKSDDVKPEVKLEEKKEKKFIRKDAKAFHSQKYDKLSETVDKTKIYSLNDALELLEKLQRKSFDETVEIHLILFQLVFQETLYFQMEQAKKQELQLQMIN